MLVGVQPIRCVSRWKHVRRLHCGLLGRRHDVLPYGLLGRGARRTRSVNVRQGSGELALLTSACVGARGGGGGAGAPGTVIQASVATVRSSTSQGASASTSTTACAGTPYQLTTGTCTACANAGAGTSLVGTTVSTCAGNGSPCCNNPYFYIQMNTTNSPMYPFMEFNVGVRARPHGLQGSRQRRQPDAALTARAGCACSKIFFCFFRVRARCPADGCDVLLVAAVDHQLREPAADVLWQHYHDDGAGGHRLVRARGAGQRLLY